MVTVGATTGRSTCLVILGSFGIFWWSRDSYRQSFRGLTVALNSQMINFWRIFEGNWVDSYVFFLWIDKSDSLRFEKFSIRHHVKDDWHRGICIFLLALANIHQARQTLAFFWSWFHMYARQFLLGLFLQSYYRLEEHNGRLLFFFFWLLLLRFLDCSSQHC